MDKIIVIDKPKDWTSRDVVNKIGKKLNTRKIGHTGTLDPLATGVLVLATGKALRLIELLTNDDKEYIAEVQMGVLTDTLDITGNVLKKEEVRTFSKEYLSEVLSSFLGISIQEVPLYSALKVNGKRLYEYARENKDIELPKRKIEIKDIELLNLNNNKFTFRVVVSKGTYIRSLIRDIGNKLDIACTMVNLRRTRQGNFIIEDANDIDSDNLKMLDIEEALANYPSIVVDEELEFKIRNGVKVERFGEEDSYLIKSRTGNLIAIYKTDDKDNRLMCMWKFLG